MFGGENRIYATIKFVLYTLVGSLLMLVAIMWVWSLGGHSFDISYLSANLRVPLGIQTWLFLAFALAFAIKVPIFPLHTWLPDAHTEAPTAGSVMLAGVLLKMGTYGFLRFCFPFFPNASHQFAPLFIALAVIGIIYGAIVSAVQPDMKRLVAYSSVSHLGFVMLGLFAFNQIGWQGATIQMVNHGVSTGALFLCVGLLYDQRHTRLIREYGGVANVMPMFYVVFLVSLLSSVGLPALNGFIGEFNILLGAFQMYPVWTVIATSGVILAAVYLLWMFQRVMYGKVTDPHVAEMKDINARQMLYFAPLLILMVVLGLYPNMIFHKTQTAVASTLLNTDLKAQENTLLSQQSAPTKAQLADIASARERSAR
jgi:NADH-quinone oxidoreductase subunit M